MFEAFIEKRKLETGRLLNKAASMRDFLWVGLLGYASSPQVVFMALDTP